MEMKIEQLSNGNIVLNNVVLNGSAKEILEYMKDLGWSKPNNNATKFMSTADKSTFNPKITESQFDSWAAEIRLDSILISSNLLSQENRAELLDCLPNYINKYKILDPARIPPYFTKAHNSVCAYVFNQSAVEKSIEYTIAKYNKILFDRTHPDNIISAYRIDGKIIVLLTQYPVREKSYK